MRPKLVKYSDDGVATFQCTAGRFDVPGLTRAAAESAVFAIRKTRGDRVEILLCYTTGEKRHFQGGRITAGRAVLRAVADE
jgi:hypothetical protein